MTTASAPEVPTDPSRTPRATRIGRIGSYLNAQFPPVVYILLGSASFASTHFGLQALAGDGVLRVTWRMVAGAATVVLIMLLMRVYDELKDVDDDRRLAAAGDPKYLERPIVTGLVREDDLRALRWVVTLLLAAINFPLGVPWPLAAFGVVMLYAWLTYRWFFWPAVKRHLLLAFATHNPLGLVVSGYVTAVYVADFGADGLSGWAFVLIVGLWTPLGAWETSRKLRHPDDETDYATYSKVLGPRVAGVIPIVLVAASVACLVPFARQAGLSWIYPGILIAAALAPIAGCGWYLLAPPRGTAPVRPLAEVYMLTVSIGLTVALAVARGVESSPSLDG